MAGESRFTSIAGTIAQAQRDAERDDERRQDEHIDFKMVTFSLGGKDYAVDIMKVKEIAKFGNFTYVPNTMHFVRGVYNLRGEIISVIDLREMFGVPVPDEEKAQESGLIVRVDDHLLGVVVDSIDRVVGISSSEIQPPHPIFADVNIRYISGVVEHEDRLYIILDVERIFAREDGRVDSSGLESRAAPGIRGGAGATEATGTPARGDLAPSAGVSPDVSGAGQPSGDAGADQQAGAAASGSPAPGRPQPAAADTDVSFIGEALAAFNAFYPSPVNAGWLSRRSEEWKAERSRAGKDIQLRTEEDAAAFIQPYFSPYTEAFWGEDYLERVARTLPDDGALPGNLNVWNPGCGKGYETYSFAVLLRKTYPDKRIKIWASDIDLLSISTAPNLVFPAASVPEYYREYLVEGTNGFSFAQEIKELILFEYHDVLHENTVPEVGVILSRDLLSMLPQEAQYRVTADFSEKVGPGGIVIPGAQEALDALSGWRSVGGAVNAYTTVVPSSRSTT
ncbi:MAG: chemotaxis protein CheR [Spirochaetes bacterium]|jgi:purine-binding chemotaxis protein CheW|nr:chemotaxis protein CheR [Spirochaetota bacterium]